ncbi:hypothetical protein [uncultured Tenacibaculum sp.]|uniref:hypothetical protein n=1 Tax=uncultured Tenacibaculum sp. TaxID=174713 RepID=UPI0026149B5E|nr:hypothetical protein [uncultured Tenacibaculum sp.]
MKKSILNLGKSLNKAEQKKINGGIAIACFSHSDCPREMGCCKNAPYMGLCMLGSDYRNYCN